LQEIVDALNGDKHPDTTDFLRVMLRCWKEADWDLNKLYESNPGLEEMLQKLWTPPYYMPSPEGGARLLPMFVGPTATSTFYEMFKGGPLKELLNQHEELPFILAIQHFGALTVLEWQKLGGPCARCHRYYIKRRASQKAYCSRRCGNAATATVRTAKQREHEREANLQRAYKAIQQWKRTGKQTNWKEFVARKTGLTPKWLTRAVGRNDLKAPKEEL
jgi:hypothetical protein